MYILFLLYKFIPRRQMRVKLGRRKTGLVKATEFSPVWERVAYSARHLSFYNLLRYVVHLSL